MEVVCFLQPLRTDPLVGMVLASDSCEAKFCLDSVNGGSGLDLNSVYILM